MADMIPYVKTTDISSDKDYGHSAAIIFGR